MYQVPLYFYFMYNYKILKQGRKEHATIRKTFIIIINLIRIKKF